MTLIDWPQPLTAGKYESIIQQVVAKLAPVAGVRSIYQIGHVSSPGISDLDLLVVFDSTASYCLDPRRGLDATAGYVLVHPLFAVTSEDYAEATELSFFHNYKLRWGQPLPVTTPAIRAQHESSELKRQIALEYMLRIYLSLFVELTYGILKVRNLLLHAKALQYDCEFLDICGGDLHAASARIAERRNDWFSAPPSPRVLTGDAVQLCHALELTLCQEFERGKFFLPAGQEKGASLARHIEFAPGPQLSVRHQGPRLPSAFATTSRKYVNLLHRLHRFQVALPFTCDGLPPVIQRTFNLRARLADANRRVSPHFMTLSTNFTVA